MGGLVSAVFGGGEDQAEAAQQAAGVQAAATREAAQLQKETTEKQIEFQKESRDIARGDLAPFKEAGQSVLDPLTALITDPNKQAEFVLNNPFFNALSKESERNILQNQAAKGKVGSGETAEALQNSLVLLGADLLNTQVTQSMNLATLGQNAAAGQGTITQNAASNISNIAQTGANNQSELITSGAAATAAGIVGAQNARTNNANQLLNLAGTIGAEAICDIRMKENINHVGYTNKGLPLYMFNYIGDDKPHINVMAQDVEKVMPEAVIEKNGIKFVKMEVVYGH